MPEIFAAIYAVGFVVAAVLAAAANPPTDHADKALAGALGLVLGLVWPVVAFAWAIGQVAKGFNDWRS